MLEERVPMRFIDLFAGLGGFHQALSALGHECVFASEIDAELRKLYRANFPDFDGPVAGDIREAVRNGDVPSHDLLCAGFPCQPFSKSGGQEGFSDRTRGTLYHEIYKVLKQEQPKYVILENVGNFARHDDGRTWRIVRESLKNLGYEVRGTEHICDGGHGLVSPHHLGYPHHRNRFFVVASGEGLPANPFPPRENRSDLSVADIEQEKSELSEEVRERSRLPDRYVECIEHWNELLKDIPPEKELPSAPIWGDEIEASYPFEQMTPYDLDSEELAIHVQARRPTSNLAKRDLIALLPPYARTEAKRFPEWKRRYIRKNREWFDDVRAHVEDEWIARLQEFPASLRKLEWNCKGERRDLWGCVLQFRPSGLRASRYDTVPSLVAMTTSQIPVLGPRQRFLTEVEGLRLQGFPDSHQLPSSRADAFSALGNAVHVGVVQEIATRLLHAEPSDASISRRVS